MTEYIPVEKTRKGYYAIWEEGGRIHPDFGGGEAIIIVDEHGVPVVPVFIRTHSDRKNGILENGKHALIILKPKYHIIKVRVPYMSEPTTVPEDWTSIRMEILQVNDDMKHAFIEERGNYYAVCERITAKGQGSPIWEEDYIFRNLAQVIQRNLMKAVHISIKKAYCFRCTHAHGVMENPNKPKPTRWDVLDTDW